MLWWKTKYYDIKQVSLIFSKQSNKVPNGVPYTVVNEHRNANYDGFKIIGSGFRNNAFKRKVDEALLIKELRPILNIQEKSVELKLFN